MEKDLDTKMLNSTPESTNAPPPPKPAVNAEGGNATAQNSTDTQETALIPRNLHPELDFATPANKQIRNTQGTRDGTNLNPSTHPFVISPYPRISTTPGPPTDSHRDKGRIRNLIETYIESSETFKATFGRHESLADQNIVTQAQLVKVLLREALLVHENIRRDNTLQSLKSQQA